MQSVEEWLKNKNAGAVSTVSGLQSVSDWKKTRPDIVPPVPIAQKFAETLPATTQVLAELQTDPLSFKADPKNWLNAATQSMSDTISQEGKNVEDYLTRTFITEKDKPLLSKVGEGLVVGGKAVISSVFSPITALFAGAKEVPALGTVARLIEVPFIAAGEGGAAATSALIDKSPLPQNVKDDIKPGLTDLAALIAQLAIGKVGINKAGILKTKKTELTKKYGEQEANTIIEKAQEIVGKQTEVTTSATSIPGKMSVAEWQAAGKPKEVAPVVERVAEPVISPELEPLAAEARKYKSAEEFVTAKLPSEKAIKPQATEAASWSTVSKNLEQGKPGIEQISNGNMHSFIYRDKNGNPTGVLKLNDAENIGDLKYGRDMTISVKPEFQKQGIANTLLREAQSKGFNTVEFFVSKDNIYTQEGYSFAKKQLTDFYNQAVKPTIETVTVPRAQLPVGEGELRLSRLEARMKEQLEAVPQEIQDTISTYNQMNKADQIKGASEYVTRNPEEALAVLRGEVPAPKGLLHNAIGLALEQVAKGNQDLATKLTSLRSTRAGQEISILTERDPLSPVKYMSEIADKRIEIKGGKERLAKTRNIETANIKKSINKSNLAKTDWNAFIDSITC